MSTAQNCCSGAFHSNKNSEISGPKLNGTVRIPGKVFENLGMRFEYNLFDGISGIIENFHSQEISGLGYALRLQDAVSNRNSFTRNRIENDTVSKRVYTQPIQPLNPTVYVKSISFSGLCASSIDLDLTRHEFAG